MHEFRLVPVDDDEGSFPLDYRSEYTQNGIPLEVAGPSLGDVRLKTGDTTWERFGDFMPFAFDPTLSLGEGSTPLVRSGALEGVLGIENCYLKCEMYNPTLSFKDRGTLCHLHHLKSLGERVTGTISTGNMGNSTAAYAACAGIRAAIFAPNYTTLDKVLPMFIHGAEVFTVKCDDYSAMKREVFGLCTEMKLRITTGNNPIRAEGYKLIAFEIFEQLGGRIPDYVVVPTSTGGNVRGIFKGFRELHESGMADRLPKMIVVQAANNAPIVQALKRGMTGIVPFPRKETIATAITSNNPPGGNEIVSKAIELGWLYEDVTEQEIVSSQTLLSAAGFFVEPATAVTIGAVRKLAKDGRISPGDSVVNILTGSGFKDLKSAASTFNFQPEEIPLDGLGDRIRSRMGLQNEKDRL